MKIQTTKLAKSEIEISVEVPIEKIKPYLERAAKNLSEDNPIKGFRPGHAPYEVVKQNLGEMAIYEEAVWYIIQDTFFEALEKEKIEAIGQPKIDLEKLAPNNPIIYKATIAVLPKVTVGDWTKIKIEKKSINVQDKEVERALKTLQSMQAKEVIANRPATEKDKIVVDMNMFLDNVPIEGGQTKNHAIYLSEKYYLPEVKEKLIGIKKGEKREFTITFPKEHFQKNLAGKNVLCRVVCNDVFEVIEPELNDEFAQSLGKKTLDDLKEIIKQNIQSEKIEKEQEMQEREILKKLIKISDFEPIPELLINTEVNKMISELEYGLNKQGLKMDDYLKQIKKSIGDLKLDFVPQATERIKSALISREIAKIKNINVTDKEIDEEIEKTLKLYPDDKNIRERIKSKQSRQYLRNSLINKKVLDFLKKECCV